MPVQGPQGPNWLRMMLIMRNAGSRPVRAELATYDANHA